MIDIKDLRENTKKFKDGVVKKGVDSKAVDDFLKVDKQWRQESDKLDRLRAKQKELSERRAIEEAKQNKNLIKDLEEKLAVIEGERLNLLEKIPNLLADGVPIGKNESANKVRREGGKKTAFRFTPRDYLALGESLDIIDVKQAAEVAGARFGYLKGAGALLELALIQFAFDTLVKEGFVPVMPPVMIKPQILRAMGKGKFIDEEEAFYVEKDNLFLVGSAEHTLGPLHKDDVFAEKDLPKKYTGFSTCFRREAGSYGKDTKGILRVHQFDKVEMFVFAHPKDSDRELDKLVALQEKLIRALKLPYRVMELCAGDVGWGDARQFDVEVWLPGQQCYRETNSASDTTDFQARGINARYRTKENKLEFVHMLNATAFAIGRMIIAIIENYQTKEGGVKIPKVLQRYIGFDEIRPR